jgi:hypothetical protein
LFAQSEKQISLPVLDGLTQRGISCPFYGHIYSHKDKVIFHLHRSSLASPKRKYNLGQLNFEYGKVESLRIRNTNSKCFNSVLIFKNTDSLRSGSFP